MHRLGLGRLRQRKHEREARGSVYGLSLHLTHIHQTNWQEAKAWLIYSDRYTRYSRDYQLLGLDEVLQ